MEDGGRLDVALGVEADGRVFFSVSDTGPGIPEDKLKRIFEPFYTTSQREGASGLGLSIAYGLVREMGGQISVESVPGQGAKFTVSLPRKSPQENPAIAAQDCKYHQKENK
jgi:two-component system NtrC family sensor kinase